MSLAMFQILVVPVVVLAAVACGTYLLGRAWPAVAAVLATGFTALAGAIFWYAWQADLGDGPGAALGLVLAGALGGLAVFVAVGFAAGVWRRPGLIAGPWAGVACAAILVAWQPARGHPGLGALAFFACCAVGAAWAPAHATQER